MLSNKKTEHNLSLLKCQLEVCLDSGIIWQLRPKVLHRCLSNTWSMTNTLATLRRTTRVQSFSALVKETQPLMLSERLRKKESYSLDLALQLTKVWSLESMCLNQTWRWIQWRQRQPLTYVCQEPFKLKKDFHHHKSWVLKTAFHTSETTNW